MIDKPTRVGNTELYNARVLNMSVARYYGVMKEYIECLTETRKLNKEELEKNGKPQSLIFIFPSDTILTKWSWQNYRRIKMIKFLKNYGVYIVEGIFALMLFGFGYFLFLAFV